MEWWAACSLQAFVRSRQCSSGCNPRAATPPSPHRQQARAAAAAHVGLLLLGAPRGRPLAPVPQQRVVTARPCLRLIVAIRILPPPPLLLALAAHRAPAGRADPSCRGGGAGLQRQRRGPLPAQEGCGWLGGEAGLAGEPLHPRPLAMLLLRVRLRRRHSTLQRANRNSDSSGLRSHGRLAGAASTLPGTQAGTRASMLSPCAAHQQGLLRLPGHWHRHERVLVGLQALEAHHHRLPVVLPLQQPGSHCGLQQQYRAPARALQAQHGRASHTARRPAPHLTMAGFSCLPGAGDLKHSLHLSASGGEGPGPGCRCCFRCPPLPAWPRRCCCCCPPLVPRSCLCRLSSCAGAPRCEEQGMHWLGQIARQPGAAAFCTQLASRQSRQAVAAAFKHPAPCPAPSTPMLMLACGTWLPWLRSRSLKSYGPPGAGGPRLAKPLPLFCCSREASSALSRACKPKRSGPCVDAEMPAATTRMHGTCRHPGSSPVTARRRCPAPAAARAVAAVVAAAAMAAPAAAAAAAAPAPAAGPAAS